MAGTSLLGASCARVLVAVKTQSTTLELARRFGLAAGGVSVQLSKLKKAGMVDTRRAGREVYYRLSSRGRALLALFEPDT